MTFDCVVCNPPYQAPTDNKGVGHTLWDKFVEKCLDITKKDGYMAMIHPAGWRRPTGTFKELGETMRSKQIEYLEIHNIEDGQKTFGVCTRYDWYILHNKVAHRATTIKSEDGKQELVDISHLPCIPNGEFSSIAKLLAKNEKERINLMRSESAYEPRRPWMSKDQTKERIHVIDDRSNYGADKPHVSKDQTEEFKYPCIYSLPQKGMQLRWSSTNQNGHFGVPKVIFSNGAAPEVIIDETGKYGLTQWAFGIVDKPYNLKKIQVAMNHPRFIELCKYMRFTLDRYDVKFISLLRKDFYKDFVDENGKEI